MMNFIGANNYSYERKIEEFGRCKMGKSLNNDNIIKNKLAEKKENDEQVRKLTQYFINNQKQRKIKYGDKEPVGDKGKKDELLNIFGNPFASSSKYKENFYHLESNNQLLSELRDSEKKIRTTLNINYLVKLAEDL